MRRNGFGRSVLFAAAAGAAWPAFALLAGPLLGPRAALSLYLVAVAALYVAVLRSAPARGLAAALAVLGFGGALMAVGCGPREVAVGAALAVGVCRSGILHRARTARALAIELGLLGGGLLLARFLAAPGLLGIALGIWGFFLVQSADFLIGGVRERSAGPAGVDPFERARRRLTELLAEER
jgi:hypothetical protein